MQNFTIDLYPKGFFQCWKTALIISVHKKGDPFDIANNRPISLLPLFSEILEKLALSQLSCYLSDGDLLSNKQHGFHCRRSTETALGLLSGLISEAKRKKLHTILVTIDFSKTFDVLDVNVLLRSLASINDHYADHYGGLNPILLEGNMLLNLLMQIRRRSLSILEFHKEAYLAPPFLTYTLTVYLNYSQKMEV